MGKTLLQINNLTKEFPIKGGLFGRKVGNVRAVNNVTLQVAKGSAWVWWESPVAASPP